MATSNFMKVHKDPQHPAPWANPQVASKQKTIAFPRRADVRQAAGHKNRARSY